MKESITHTYLCDTCKHRSVCANKDMYMAFQNALNKIEIDIPGTVRVAKIEDIAWLKPTKLDCADFLF